MTKSWEGDWILSANPKLFLWFFKSVHAIGIDLPLIGVMEIIGLLCLSSESIRASY